MYYFNPLTNDSSWVKPEGFTGGVSEAVPTSQLRVPGTAWFEIHCEDGRKYYYNDKSEVNPGSRTTLYCIHIIHIIYTHTHTQTHTYINIYLQQVHRASQGLPFCPACCLLGMVAKLSATRVNLPKDLLKYRRPYPVSCCFDCSESWGQEYLIKVCQF